jgi:predicted tellurium resistance membrane protein TerC
VDWLTDPQIWASLVTLTALEIVLGIDNLVFITILSGRLPAKRQNRARQLGLALALVTRLVLLGSIAWIVGLTQPLFEVFGHTVSWRDLILMGGGLFLLYKGTREIHHRLEGDLPGEQATRVLAVSSCKSCCSTSCSRSIV